MKNLLLISTLACSTLSFAHEPFIAPYSYITENTQIPVIAAYAEDALIAEYAMKDIKQFDVILPNQQAHKIDTTMVKSATFANLELKDQGTYQIFTTASYPLKYAYHQKQWKIFYDMEANKADAKRDYVIPSDFRTSPKFVEIKRHWLIQSFVTKGETTPIQTVNDYPLHVIFSTHPNQIKANQAFDLTVSKNNQPLHAEIEVHAKGDKHENGRKFTTNALGQANLSFPKAGDYVITISEPFDTQKKPTDQYYVISTISAHE